jgi:SAM-dependent methyltransferase
MLVTMSFDRETVHTYNRSAKEMADKFAGIGSRVADVELGIELAGSPEAARVVEIGCGDGRDAVEIVQRAGWYEGVDPSSGLLELARQRNLNGSFVEADALSYDYPKNLDIVFAFASLLHVSRADLRQVFNKIHEGLRDGGIAYVSLKERPEYVEEMQHDDLGSRKFYYYTVPIVVEAAGAGFSAVYEDHQHIGSTDWFTLALQKV